MAINQRGDVVGFSNPDEPGDAEGEFISRAFLWTSGSAAATDLGTLSGDLFSEAFAINASGQVVGVSFGGANGSRAFIWQNGVMTNLNDLVGTGSAPTFSNRPRTSTMPGRSRDGCATP